MPLCNSVIDMTPRQRAELGRLQAMAVAVLDRVTLAFPHEVAWKSVRRAWGAQELLLGPTPHRATFDAAGGCFLVGVPPDGGRPAALNARVLLALSAAATNGKRCTGLHQAIVDAATALQIPLALDCDDVEEHALTPARRCAARRTSWPELLGLPVARVAEMFPRTRVELSTWDSMWVRPAARDVVRVTYDARTGTVVAPAPHIGTVNVPEIDTHCFSLPDAGSGARCIGAPPAPPPEWSKLDGKLLQDVVDTLRTTYPHATIEALPQEAAVTADKRPDRIRVRFDGKGLVRGLSVG